ncbi:hypothetical protein K1T71_012686 [Dendrolimus kikuchii]|uniref:Uncharacterized protein n=1 Tax=Dendrolimus kikuchii TaxID=765133 RepID=A0ACC1CK06_9NEOP|nr:hypothetical protein K1T71_012686 [Dendrolimus kikuchii]
MGLPANVQRVFLIQLIQTKTCKTREELELLIQHVKEQRALSSAVRRMKSQKGRVQGSEISSTSSITSPIRRAPKRHSQLLFRYSPEAQLTRYKIPKAKLDVSKPQTSTENSNVMPSTCGMKMVTYHPSPRKRCIVNAPSASRNEFNNTSPRNRRILRSNAIRRQSVILTEINPDESNDYSAINIVSYDGKCKRKITAYVKKRGIRDNDNVLMAIEDNPERTNQLAQVPRESTPKKSRKRTISGISPLNVAENSTNSYNNGVPATAYSDNNENMSNISPIYDNVSEVQEIFTSEVNCATEYIYSDSELSSRFPNITFELSQNGQLTAEQRDLPDHETYYHRNVRSTMLRSQTVTNIPRTNTVTLPKIVDVFTKFNQTGRDVTRPIYVDVSNDAGTAQYFNQYTSEVTPANTSASLMKTSGSLVNISTSLENTSLLETLYNFKKSFIVMNDLFPPISRVKVGETKLVYNNKTVVTPLVQPPAQIIATECIVAPFSRHEFEQFNPVRADLPPGYNCSQNTSDNALQQDLAYSEVLSEPDDSPVPPGCLEETGANVTIPEMVEDAMEIISQDRDYMVRIEMDTISCVLCNWVGPANMIEFHVRQEHSRDILQEVANEWNITYTLASLVRGQWISKIIEYDCDLYVLSAKYEDPDHLMVSLNVLIYEECELLYKSKITIFNKVTGEPIVWQGNIVRLPETLPSSFGESIMIVPLSKLDVLPNCTNLASGKVVRQPDLNDIHIIFFIELYK